MLLSSLLSNAREGSVSPRTPATGVLTLNPRTGALREKSAAGPVRTSAGAIGDLARRGPHLSLPAHARFGRVACEGWQPSEFHKKSSGSLPPAFADASAIESGGAKVSILIRHEPGGPNAVNAAVNQMDQVTPQNAGCLIPTFRKGQFAPRAGRRSRRKGRG